LNEMGIVVKQFEMQSIYWDKMIEDLDLPPRKIHV
jgi:hypothetical protein